MSSDSNNGWLHQSFRVNISPHLFGGLDAVHHWHVEICEDYLVGEAQISRGDQLIESFLASNAEVYLVLCIDTGSEKHSFHGFDAELLVVDHHDSGVLELLVALHPLERLSHILRNFS